MKTASPKPSLWLLVAILSSGQLAVTIFLPSLPFMAADLAASQTQVQFVVTVYLASFGLAQLVIGPLSDSLGRRPVLLAGLGLYTLASAAAALAPSIQILLLARILQAVGGCASLVVSRAVIRDTADGITAAKANAYLGMSLAAAPALAPIIGGQLEAWFDWRASFHFIAITGLLVSLAALWWLPETLPAAKRHPSSFARMFPRYLYLTRMRSFMGYSLLISFLSGGFQGYLAAAPVVVIVIFGVPPELFGWYLIAIPIGFTLGNFASSPLASRVGMDRLILVAVAVGSLSGGALLLVAAAGGGLLPTLALLAVYAVISGLTFPISLASALNVVEPNMAGAAAAVGGFTQMLFGSITTAIVAAIVIQSAVPLALMISGSVTAGLITFVLMVRPRLSRRPRA